MNVWIAGTEKKLFWEGFWESALWGAHIHSAVPLLNAVHVDSHLASQQLSLFYLSSQPVCLAVKKALQFLQQGKN